MPYKFNPVTGKLDYYEVASSGGITHATATGTDTYVATITGVTAYADADAYLIRFTNGNTGTSTLNINGLGAKTLYRNNDGVLLGGDIWDGAEMLCVFNSTTDGFQCIGTTSNSLFSYVTNADSVTLTKGMPVYAFGGTGDRMTVKRANNTADATSAQTVGIVFTSSIAAGQKGIIMMQGLLDGLSILPTATWSDGDPVYLGATDGSITNIKPSAPNHLVYLGVVTTASNGSSGRMYVRVQNGYELDELHDLSITTPKKGDTIEYDGSLWVNNGIVYTVELIDALTVDFYAPYDLKINTISNVLNSPTITILDDGTSYTLTNTIAIGSKITVTANTAAVINLNIVKA
jgi:hypothetical protein